MKWLSTILAFILVSPVYSTCKSPTEAEEVATISNSSLEENSGMDFSTVHPNVFWTLNDANNDAQIFAINTDGENLGAYTIRGAENVDWEDISVVPCLNNPEKTCIYIADTGNNKGAREDFKVYVVEEPTKLKGTYLNVIETYTFTVDGRYNFESFSVNPLKNEFYFISKSGKKDELKHTSVVFSLKPGASTLKPISTIDFKNFPMELTKQDMTVTSGDFDVESQTFLIGTYGKAFEIPLKSIGSFNSKAKVIEIPEMEKAEAIAYNYSDEELAIFTSSEGLDQPLYKISCE